MLDPFHCLFQVDLGRREICLCHYIRQDVFGQSLRSRLGGMAVDAGGFEMFAVSERIDRHADLFGMRCQAGTTIYRGSRDVAICPSELAAQPGGATAWRGGSKASAPWSRRRRKG